MYPWAWISECTGCATQEKQISTHSKSEKNDQAHLSLMDMCLAIIRSLISSSCSGWTRLALQLLPSVHASGGSHTLPGEPDAALDVTTADAGSSASASKKAHTQYSEQNQ